MPEFVYQHGRGSWVAGLENGFDVFVKGTGLRVISLNPAYEQFEILVSGVTEMWKPVSYFSKEVNASFSFEESLLNIMKDLKAEISGLRKSDHS